jgi:hypothetical protein
VYKVACGDIDIFGRLSGVRRWIGVAYAYCLFVMCCTVLLRYVICYDITSIVYSDIIYTVPPKTR